MIDMSKVHLVVPDPHAHPEHDNNRADWLGQLIKDLKPDVVVNLGDAADMASLSNYDKGKASFHGKNYEKDIQSHLDFQKRMWAPIRKSKRKMPYRVVLEGNHEHRLKRALEYDPQLEGEKFGMSFNDFDFNRYYHDVVEYDGMTPGLITIDGITYAHFMISGAMGRPISGVHHAASLIAKGFTSCTVGHSHLMDFSVRTDVTGKKIMGCVAGVYQDYPSSWAGNVNNLWWSGVVIKREVEDGVYDPEFVSIARLRKEYGQ
jgi:hypothetical protein